MKVVKVAVFQFAQFRSLDGRNDIDELVNAHGRVKEKGNLGKLAHRDFHDFHRSSSGFRPAVGKRKENDE
ncbi:hypothetical protein [Rhizobium mulingense]|uniref:hypothetical protein n=1 Tax=Rhizobium mulingense TaxID=3031128 RepID=UPI002B4A7342|nr:hypothetical protein [Rhizobium sp. MJ21]MEB3047045.1 hypothetical protein [Rhizobium sp. MJ21]